MDKIKLKQTWLEALRSGKYKQTQWTLHNSEGYCCLGVAAKVWGLSDEKEMFRKHAGTGPAKVYNSLKEIMGEPLLMLCATMNDNWASFTQIADRIEKEWIVAVDSE
jgi:hypothetical protein